MDIWHTLGIDVTDDLKKIKKAYSDKTKEFHPEEHPVQFKEIYKAYKSAISYAKFVQTSISKNSDENLGLDIEDFFVNEKSIDTSSKIVDDLQNIETPLQKSDKLINQSLVDISIFEDLDDINKQEEENRKALITEYVRTASKIYQSKKQQSKKWLEYFKDPKLIELQYDYEFTCRFLTILPLPPNICPELYSKLTDWSHIWTNTAIKNIFDRVLSFEVIQNKNKIGKVASLIFSILFIILIISPKNNKPDKETLNIIEQKKDIAESIVETIEESYSENIIFTEEYNEYLKYKEYNDIFPVTQQDLDNIEFSQDPTQSEADYISENLIKDFVISLTLKRPYEEIERTALCLGIDETIYEKLQLLKAIDYSSAHSIIYKKPIEFKIDKDIIEYWIHNSNIIPETEYSSSTERDEQDEYLENP